MTVYNRYINSGGNFTRVTHDTGGSTNRGGPLDGLGLSSLPSLLKGILPDWLDPGDAVLLLLLLLLYIDSDDSDFLIILAVIAYSIFKGG